jgi:Oxygenase domain of the 2OGFeDO superfamily
MLKIQLVKERPEVEVAAGGGLLFDEKMIDLLVEETSEVYTPGGELLAKYLRAALPEDMSKTVYQVLRSSAKESLNRGMAGGIGTTGEKSQIRIRKDGIPARTNNPGASKPIRSGIVGYFDRYIRIPYCRQTAWTMSNPDYFMAALPALQLADRLFAEHIPDRYAVQQAYVNRTHREWVIPGTVFTTVTVNSNFQTAQHKDAGDLREGFGVMVCLGHDFTGGYLMFPKYKVGFAMRPGDLILADVHQFHCNTPIKLTKSDGERLSLVLYFRENMERCGTTVEEIERAKNRKPGDQLWEAETPLFD